MASMIYAPASCSWELSPVYRHASSTVFFPASLLVVSTHQERVILRRSDTLEIQRTWTLPVPAQRPTATATTTAAKSLRERNSSSVARPASPTTHKPAIEAPLLTHLSISPNEPHHIVVYAPKVSTAWVLSIESGEPIARLEIGAEGCAAIAWSPDGSRLLAWSGNHVSTSIWRNAHVERGADDDADVKISSPARPKQIRLTVYDLTEPRQSAHILSPKLVFPLGISHSPTQPSIFALVERHNSRDVIAIYHSRPQTTTLINSFQLPSHTSDVADVAFSPCGRYLAVWEHAVNDLIVHIYSKSGQLLKTFAPYSSTNLGVEPKHGASGNIQDEEVDEPKKRMLEKELRREERLTEGWVGMGVRSIRWHPSGEYLAIGGWDGKIRILSRLGWRPMAELLHPAKVPSSVAVFEEPSSWISRTLGHGIVPFETSSTPFNPPSIRPDLDRPMPQMGVKHLAWSKSGEWLASHHQTYPTALWVFSFSAPASSPDGDSIENRTIRPTLHSLIVHDTAVTSFEWSASPNLPEELAIATGTKSFTTWRGPDPRSTSSKACVEGVGIPARNVDFQANGLKFSMDGQELLLHDRTMFVVAYPVADE